MFRFIIRSDKLGKLFCDVGLIVVLLALFAMPVFDIMSDQDRALGFLSSSSGMTSFMSSLFYALLAACLSVFTGFLAGVLSHRYWPGKFILFAVLAGFLVLPDTVSFMLSASLLFFWSGKESLLVAFMGNFLWGSLLVTLMVNSFMGSIGKDEIESATFLGASQAMIVMKLFFPRLKKLLLALLFLLASFNLVLGFHFYFSWTPIHYLHTVPSKFVFPFSWFLRGPRELFVDFSAGAVTYLVLLFFAIISGMFFVKRMNEAEFAGEVIAKKKTSFRKGSRKKVVTRKPPRKRRKKS
jgi:ABC-type spermidine/putrescine transport system permease subunit II